MSTTILLGTLRTKQMTEHRINGVRMSSLIFSEIIINIIIIELLSITILLYLELYWPNR